MSFWDLWDYAENIIEEIRERILSRARSVISSVGWRLNSVARTVLNTIQGFLGSINLNISLPPISQIKIKAAEVYNRVKNIASAVYNQIKAGLQRLGVFVTGIPNAIKVNASTFWNLLTQKWQSFINSANRALSTIKTKLVENWNNFKTSVTKGFEKLVEKIKSLIPEDVVQGFLSLVDAVKNVSETLASFTVFDEKMFVELFTTMQNAYRAVMRKSIEEVMKT